MTSSLKCRYALFLAVALPAVFFVPAQDLHAARFRFRAREHFEFLTVKYGALNDTENYFGLTNTLNAWFEEPFHYAWGLSFGPMLGSAKTSSAVPPVGTDKKIRLWNIGFEGKYFFRPMKSGFFGRAGVTANVLDTRGSMGKLGGGGYYLGLGWEFPVRRVGIAPEIAFRHVILEQGGSILAFTPSIGVHFYSFTDLLLKR